MAYKKLSHLSTGRQNWNIQVEVIRMWNSVNPIIDLLISLEKRETNLMDKQVYSLCISRQIVRAF